jgi:hypothetical protein
MKKHSVGVAREDAASGRKLRASRLSNVPAEISAQEVAKVVALASANVSKRICKER